EKLRLDRLRIAGAERLLFFKHEERPLLVHPSKLVLGRTQRDELNRGYAKLNVAFTLPPGSYATLVVKRLFHRTAREDTPEEIQASAGSGRAGVEQAWRDASSSDPESRRVSSPRPPSRAPGPPATGAAPPGLVEPGRPSSGGPRPGFRARAKARKEAKAAARARQKVR
ncbi:MAG TPA: tRNA pseudouridine(13) synthase TruD, partial [Myxococcaceae bacterium]|nr:tRNA pseudouridine(13) synthase TruD [Myxococcaceae bacterium]